MRTLSLTQPWASLVVWGHKAWETRSWETSHRGRIAVHASKGFPRWAIECCFDTPFSTTLNQMGCYVPDDLPRGMVVGVVTLVDCRRTEDVRDSLSAQEREFGDYSNGRWAWKLSDPRRLSTPIPATGSLGLWDWQAPESLEGLLVAP